MKNLTIEGFLAEMARMAVAVAAEAPVSLDHAARLVRAEAKREIGTYQEAAGPFAPWAELADSTKADRAAKGYAENEPLLRTGDLRDSIEYTVMPTEAHVGSDSPIAVYQELGTERIPPRSFLGGAIVRREQDVVDILGEGFVSALIGEEVAGRALQLRGEGDQ